MAARIASFTTRCNSFIRSVRSARSRRSSNWPRCCHAAQRKCENRRLHRQRVEPQNTCRDKIEPPWIHPVYTHRRRPPTPECARTPSHRARWPQSKPNAPRRLSVSPIACVRAGTPTGATISVPSVPSSPRAYCANAVELLNARVESSPALPTPGWCQAFRPLPPIRSASCCAKKSPRMHSSMVFILACSVSQNS